VILDDATLDGARWMGDEEADDAVRSLGADAWAVNRLLAGVTRDDQPLPEAIPGEIARLVVPTLPPWADLHRIRRAQAFARDNLLALTVGLFCAALPSAYGAVAGARILRMSGRLTGDVDRRINETACFVLDVLRPHGFDVGERARVAVGKVRLVHAAVRAALMRRGTEREVPINQEDLLGTLGLFSVVVLKAMARLGVRVDDRDREDYLHLWRVVGAMLGVREAFLPRDHAGMIGLLERIRVRQFGPSEDGRALMQTLLEGMERHAALPWLRGLPRVLVRRLLGDAFADMLGVPVASAATLAVVARSPALLHIIVPRVGQSLLDAVTYVKLDGQRPSFAMPTGLDCTGKSDARDPPRAQ
jgi:hypothetical protein